MHLKNALYEPSARVPMVISGPGLQQGARIDELVSLIDVYPTLMDMAEIAHPGELAGRSLMPELTGSRTTGRPAWVFSEYHSNFQNTGSFMLRQGRWKYVAYAGCESQLFDLENDPDEVSNLVSTSPELSSDMDRRLRGIVDYEAIDARAKAYDRESYRQWRQDIEDEEYRRLMKENFPLWRDEDLKKVDDLMGF